MSNPYGGGYPPPSEPDPEEPGPPYQPYQPYSGGPQPNPYGGPPAASGTPVDGVSIAGFVLSLLCCTSLVGFILGLVGMKRTKDGRRSGRWAALSAVLIGAVGTLAFVGGLVVLVWFGTSTVQVSSAEVGQCVDVDRTSSADATLWEKDCDEPHDAEIVYVGAFNSEAVDSYDSSEPQLLCVDRVGDQLSEISAENHVLGLVIDGDEDQPEVGDDFLCYVERRGDDKLEGPLFD